MKKIILIFLIIGAFLIIGFSAVEAKSYKSFEVTIVNPGDGNAYQFCEQKGTLLALQYVGVFIYVVKILAPILLIIFGSIDFGKAVISNDDAAIKKSTMSFLFRLISAVVIFFIPTIVYLFINLINSYKDIKSNNQQCYDCVFNLKCQP